MLLLIMKISTYARFPVFGSVPSQSTTFPTLNPQEIEFLLWNIRSLHIKIIPTGVKYTAEDNRGLVIRCKYTHSIPIQKHHKPTAMQMVGFVGPIVGATEYFAIYAEKLLEIRHELTAQNRRLHTNTKIRLSIRDMSAYKSSSSSAYKAPASFSGRGGKSGGRGRGGNLYTRYNIQINWYVRTMANLIELIAIEDTATKDNRLPPLSLSILHSSREEDIPAPNNGASNVGSTFA